MLSYFLVDLELQFSPSGTRLLLPPECVQLWRQMHCTAAKSIKSGGTKVLM